MKKTLFYLILIFSMSSCVTEKSNVSPLTSTFTSDKMNLKEVSEIYKDSIQENINAAEISNMIESFPILKNETVNKEILQLKYYLQNYLYAVEANNNEGKERALEKIEKSYKKIQKQRKELTDDEDNVVNRYLVKIKTNISAIESLPQKKNLK